MEIKGMCLFLFVTISMSFMISCAAVAEEPVCTSRFGFESDLLRTMIKLEFDMTVMKDKTTEALADLNTLSTKLTEEQTTRLGELKVHSNEIHQDVQEQMKQEMDVLKDKTAEALANLDTLSKNLTEEQTTRLGELTALGDEMQNGVDEKTKLFEETRTNLANDFAKLYTDFEDKTGAKWKEIEEKAIKLPIAFIAKTVSTQSPGSNTMLRFTEAVTNTGNGYDTSTGYFTAPVAGIYWFSVQMCPHGNKYIQIQIFAKNTLIASSVMYESTGSYPCSTTTTVAVLNVGDKVHVKSGGSSSGAIIYRDSYRWDSFSGALVN